MIYPCSHIEIKVQILNPIKRFTIKRIPTRYCNPTQNCKQSIPDFNHFPPTKKTNPRRDQFFYFYTTYLFPLVKNPVTKSIPNTISNIPQIIPLRI